MTRRQEVGSPWNGCSWGHPGHSFWLHLGAPAYAQTREGYGWGHVTAASAPNISPRPELATPCSRDLAGGGLTRWSCISKGEGSNGFEQTAGSIRLLPYQLEL